MSQENNNLIIVNYQNGHIVQRSIHAALLSDELIRDGWVEVHRQKVPTVHVVIQGGEVECVYSDLPAMALTIMDLDLAKDPEATRAALLKSVSGLFRFHRQETKAPTE